MAEKRKKMTLQHPGSFAALSAAFLILAVGLLLCLGLLVNGVTMSLQGENASFDLPVNVRAAGDFTKEGGFVRYPGAKLGVDVSSHQGLIDWQKVKNAGVSFAILRIGYRGYSLGGVNEDDMYRSNLEGAQLAGLDIGVYFFSQATSVAEAEEEADFVIQTLDGKALSCPVFFDWEEIPDEGSRTAGRATSEVAEYAAAFCRRVRTAGYDTGVYFNQQYGYTIMQLETLHDYDFWLAEYHDAMTFLYDVRYWQYTGSGNVDGISSDVDLDLCFTN